jgi:hypothetical protein
MLIYFLIFLLIALLSLYRNDRTEKIFYVGVSLLLFLMAGFRGNIDIDYQGYVTLFNKASNLTSIRIEPTFLIISYIAKHLFNNVLFLFLIYALIGVSLNFYAIKKLTDFCLLSVLVYFSNFYLLHEMTQIRVGVASALILLSIKPLLEKKLIPFLIIIAIAFTFHYSAILALPLYFLDGRKINVTLFVLIIPVSYLFYFLNIHLTSLIELIPIPEVSVKFLQYKNLALLNNAYKGNVFNILQLARCLFVYFLLWKWEILQQNNKYSILLIKIYIIAISILVLLSDIPGLGARASELLMPVEILLIPFLIYIFKQKQLATMSIIVIALTFMTVDIYYYSLVSPYFN